MTAPQTPWRFALISASRAVALAAALMLSACSVLPEREAVLRLDPQVRPSPSASGGSMAWTVAVPRPMTDPARDSNRVQVRTASGELQVLGRLRWIASAPDLLQNLLIRHLRDSEIVADAGSEMAYADRLLQIDLRRFEVAESVSGHEVVLVIDARWIETESGRLLDRRLIEHRSPLPSLDGATVVAAFERGLGEVAGAVATLTRS